MSPDPTIDRGNSRPAHSVLAPPRRPLRAFDRTFAPGTLLETDHGWRPVETLRSGDRVRTLRGMARITGTHRQPPDRSRVHWQIPAGQFGSASDLRLNAGQRLALLNPACKQLFGDPLVLLPVPTTTGFCGIRTVAGFTLRCGIVLHFEEEEVVFAQAGTLLHVPGATDITRHRVLSYRESRKLLAVLCGGKCRETSPSPGTDGANPVRERRSGAQPA